MAAIVSSARDKRIPAGSQLVSINRHVVEDFLDFKFHNDLHAFRHLTIAVNGSKKTLTYRPGEEIGIELKEPQYRSCENRCAYCFVDGLPRGLRRELYFKDDDYRLSFLHGNFLSLTNITDDDIRRIGRLRLSPLYISVQSTDPGLRRKIFAHQNAGRITAQLRALARNNIILHTQIVVVPGLNEKTVDKTIGDLARLYPAVRSIGVVPVGMTRYTERLRPVDKKLASRIVRKCLAIQKKFRADHGKGLVYLADEFFIKTGGRIPDAGYYDEFPQYENGIGMIRHLIDETDLIKPAALKKPRGRYAFLTGRLAARTVKWLAARIEKANPKVKITVIPVMNRLFGDTVTVSGLLGSRDFNRAISKYGGGFDKILLPPNCVNRNGLFLDEIESNPPIPSSPDPHSLSALPNLTTSALQSLSHPRTPLSPYPHFLSHPRVAIAPYRVSELIRCLQ